MGHVSNFALILTSEILIIIEYHTSYQVSNYVLEFSVSTKLELK